MVCIISQLRGWLELRSFLFMSAGPHLLLRTLAFLVTSCHHIAKPTIWAYTELWHSCQLDIPLFNLTIVNLGEHFFHRCRQEFRSWPPCWGLSGFISWLRMANVAWKGNYTHTFSAWLGCVSHGQNSKTLNMLLLAHARKQPSQAHVLCFHELFLTVFITPKPYSRSKFFSFLTSHTFRSISKDRFCVNLVFDHLIFQQATGLQCDVLFKKDLPLHWLGHCCF